jgi:hypothetical protein
MKSIKTSRIFSSLGRAGATEIQTAFLFSRKLKHPLQTMVSLTRKSSNIASLTTDLDSFNERIHRALSFDPAQPRDVLSLQNWVNGTGSLDRKETAYLTQPRELVNLATSGDSATTQLETWVEDKLIRFYEGFRQVGAEPLKYRGILTRKGRILIIISQPIRMYTYTLASLSSEQPERF